MTDTKDKRPKITKRSTKDILQVCPLCFFPLRKTPTIFSVSQTYHCRNKECGWSGAIAIEVDKEDYNAFLEEHNLINETETETEK